MADNIVTRLRDCGNNCGCHARSFYECVCDGVEWPNECLNVEAAKEIERLRAELEQAKINLQQARTGRALRDLEQERQDRQRVEQSLIQTIARLCMDARDLRAHNEQLEQQLAARRTPTVRIDVDHETAAQKIADINRTLDRMFDEINAKDDHAETEP